MVWQRPRQRRPRRALLDLAFQAFCLQWRWFSAAAGQFRQHSKEFRKRFFGRLTNLKLEDSSDCPHIHTQEPLRGVDAEEEEEDVGAENAPYANRFDLVLEHPDGVSWVIVTECKVHIDSNLCEQLQRYREALDQPDSKFKDFKKRLILTLTATSEQPLGSDAHLTWAKVQSELSRVQEIQATSSAAPDEVMAVMICKQFAEFLKQKGMGHMELRRYSPEQFHGWVAGMDFREELESILLAVRQEPKLRRVLGKRAEWKVEKECKILCLSNRQGCAYLAVAFALTEDGKPQYEAYVQGIPAQGAEGFQARAPKESNMYHWDADNREEVCFGFSLPIRTSEMDGQAETVRDWLVKHALLFVE
jgi:hypothetical protein